jgi:hypothetical protein
MRSAMLSTIWTWIQEWSDIPSRSALTCVTCHQVFSCGSAFAASSSASRRRFPRVGALIRIASIASRSGDA